MVDERLWSLGTVRLRCPSCEVYFLPSGAPHTGSIENAAIAGVPITVWEPQDAERVADGT